MPALDSARGLIIPDIGAAGSAGVLHKQFGAVLGPDFCALGARQAGQRQRGSGGKSATKKTRRVVMFGLLLCEERVMPV
jgi:hypothetical protein